MMANDPLNSGNFHEYKRKEFLKVFVPNFYRIRLLVIPLLLVLLALFIVYKEPLWKISAFFIFIIIAFSFFTIELIRLKRRDKLSDNWIGFNLFVVVLLQNGVFYLTGGFESPLVPLAILFIILSNIIFDRGVWGLLIYGAYTVGLIVMGLGAYFHMLPNIAPPFCHLDHGGLYAKPAFFWALFCIDIIVFTNAMILSRVLSHLMSGFFTELFHSREEVIKGFGERMRQIETMSTQLAHEVKNPLTAIKGLIQVLDRSTGTENERDKKRLAVISGEIDRLETIVNEFSNLTRPLDMLKQTPIDVAKVLDEIVALYEMRLSKAEIRLVRRPVFTPIPRIAADERKLKQVLVNIFENATDAMPRGGTLSAAIQFNEVRQQIELHISDTGQGIAPEQKERLFTPFFSTKPQGTGVGLAIARGIMRQQGGDLVIESIVGTGTTVSMHLPLSPQTKGGQ
jgi:two-component system sensor histidine kinase HydH